MLRRSTGMAEVSPAMYSVKRSRSALVVLVAAESTRDHEYMKVEIDLRWVPGVCCASDGKRTQLRYVGAVVLGVFQTEFLKEG
jgi:hypothetical protein